MYYPKIISNWIDQRSGKSAQHPAIWYCNNPNFKHWTLCYALPCPYIPPNPTNIPTIPPSRRYWRQ